MVFLCFKLSEGFRNNMVDDFPRTETFRVKKGELKSTGVTKDTFDAEA
jgi:hypothetical protein